MAQVRIKDLANALVIEDADHLVLDKNAETFNITIAQLKEFLSSGGASGVAIGSIMMWASEVSLPIGFQQCNGQNFLRATYPDLWAKIGLKFSPTDDGVSFWLPNYNGLVPRGIGTQTVNGRTKDGGELGELLEDQFQGHFHNYASSSSSSGGSNRRPVVSANSSGTIAETVAAGQASVREPIADNSSNGTPRIGQETRASSLGTIFIIKVEDLEVESATTSAIDSLNARVSLVESAITAIQSIAITYNNIGDIIKSGNFSYNDDGNYTVNFDTPFVNGVDADISVVLQRHGSDLQSTQGVQSITKSGFITNRENGIDGTQTYSFIAINKYYLGLGA